MSDIYERDNKLQVSNRKFSVRREAGVILYFVCAEVITYVPSVVLEIDRYLDIDSVKCLQDNLLGSRLLNFSIPEAISPCQRVSNELSRIF